jgi:circadian clock protein KaiB
MNSEKLKPKSPMHKTDLKKLKNNKYILNLFIAGSNLKGITALKNLKFICNELYKGKYKIEVIDILKNPKLARTHQIFAIPTLIRKFPFSSMNIIGDLSNREQLLLGLNFNDKIS